MFLKKGMKVKLMSTNKEYEIEKVGVFTPKAKDIEELMAKLEKILRKMSGEN